MKHLTRLKQKRNHLKSDRFTHPDHDLLFDIVHDGVPVFRMLRRIFRDQVLQVAGFDVRRDPAGVDVVQVVDHVVDHFATSLPELKTVHDSISRMVLGSKLKCKHKLICFNIKHTFQSFCVEPSLLFACFFFSKSKYDNREKCTL